jgi:hypothetical protein
VLTPAQATDLRAKLDRFNAWLDTKRARNGWANYRPEDVPTDVPQVANEDRSALEVFEFCTNPPDKYFLYIKEPVAGQAAPLVGQATTWTGDRLGFVRFGRAYRGNMGDTRVPIRIQAINGRNYYGTFYKSAGDYARVRLAKVAL